MRAAAYARENAETLAWANSILKKHNKQIPSSPETRQDGTSFIVLIESVSGAQIGTQWNQKPTAIAEIRNNIGVVYEFLEQNEIPCSIQIEDLINNRNNATISLLTIIKTQVQGRTTHPIKSKLAPISRPASNLSRNRTATGTRTEKQEAPTPAPQAVKRAKIWNIGHDPRDYTPKVQNEKKEEPKKPVKRAKIWDIGHCPKKVKEPVIKTVTMNEKQTREQKKIGMKKRSALSNLPFAFDDRPLSKKSTRPEVHTEPPVVSNPSPVKKEVETPVEEANQITGRRVRFAFPVGKQLSQPTVSESKKQSDRDEQSTFEFDAPTPAKQEPQDEVQTQKEQPKEEEGLTCEDPVQIVINEDEREKEEHQDTPADQEEPEKEEVQYKPDEEEEKEESPTPEKTENIEDKNQPQCDSVGEELPPENLNVVEEQQVESHPDSSSEKQSEPSELEDEDVNAEESIPEEPVKEQPQSVITSEPDSIHVDLEKKDSDAPVVASQEQVGGISKLCVGIDFGSSATRFGLFKDSKMDDMIIHGCIPSTVLFLNGEQRVGIDPEDYISNADADVFMWSKSLLGNTFSDEELISLSSAVGVSLAKREDSDRLIIEVGKNEYQRILAVEELAAIILGEVKRSLSEQLKEEVVDAVISVPAFFSSGQRKATVDAATLAGFNVIKLITETTGAVIARQQAASVRDSCILSVDFGASKIDLSILKSENGSTRVCKTVGDTKFGGVNFDEALLCEVSKQYASTIGSEPNVQTLRALKFACRTARHDLSSAESASIHVGSFSMTLSRTEMYDLLKLKYQRIENLLSKLFSGQNTVQKNDIKEVLFIGGMTKDPKVREIVTNFLSDVQIIDSPENAVVIGASVIGTVLASGDESCVSLSSIDVKDSLPMSLGISLANGTTSTMIPAGTPLPCSYSVITTTFKDNQKNVGFSIVEGESTIASENIKLGDVCVTGIEKAPKGVPKIKVEFVVNEDGLLVVTATDQATGAEIRTKIQNKMNLSPQEMEEMAARGSSSQRLK